MPYQPLLDEAIRLSKNKPAKVLLVIRGASPMGTTPGRDVDCPTLRAQYTDSAVPCV